jgi:hypothetical protein
MELPDRSAMSSCTEDSNASESFEICWAVIPVEKLMRTLELQRLAVSPMDLSVGSGVIFPVLQAEPVATSTPRSSSNRARTGDGTPGTERETILGEPESGEFQ